MLSSPLVLPLLLAFQGGLVGVDEGALQAGDATPWDRAGEAVALDAEVAVVGARWQDPAGADSGAAYVHLRTGTTWAQQQKLVAADASAADEFGSALAIDGDTIAVGAPTADVAGTNEGAVYVFTQVGGVWSQQAKLTASDLFDEDRFGSAVALQGDTLVVGAVADDDLGDYSGSAYVFTRVGGVWTERAKLLASDGAPGAYFGTCVALDADTALIGAPGPAGGAYVFVGSGTNWTQQAKLVDAAPGASDRFGEALDVAGDTAVVGAPLDDDNGGDSGSVVVYDRLGGAWSQTTRLVAGEFFGELGRSVALSGDLLAAGAPRDHQLGLDPLGRVYLFERTAGIWAQAASLSSSSPAGLDDFGAALDLDGDLLVAGIPGADLAGTNAGLARAFLLLPGISTYCFGDGSSSPCPCSNPGGGSTGCANSSGAGAALSATGTSSVSGDALLLSGAGLLPGQPALLFAGLNAVNGGAGNPFGDGLRCAGGAVVRIGVTSPDGAGSASWGPGIAASSGVASGDTRRYQVWYRDPVGGPCGSAFNLSNGVQVSFTP